MVDLFLSCIVMSQSVCTYHRNGTSKSSVLLYELCKFRSNCRHSFFFIWRRSKYSFACFTCCQKFCLSKCCFRGGGPVGIKTNDPIAVSPELSQFCVLSLGRAKKYCFTFFNCCLSGFTPFPFFFVILFLFRHIHILVYKSVMFYLVWWWFLFVSTVAVVHNSSVVMLSLCYLTVNIALIVR